MTSLSTQPDVKALFFSGFGQVVRVSLVVLAVSACAGLGPKAPEEAVKQRAQARWDALLKGDTTAAYSYLSPGSRAVLKQEDYATSIRKGFWKSAQVERVVCERAETCEAQLTIEYEFQRMRTKTPLRETWIREGSDWWYVQK